MELLGITYCDECNAKIKVLEKQKALIGKTVRCPKCRTRFVLELSDASNTDVTAVEAAEEKKPRRRRRTKDEIRQAHINEARAGFRSLHARLKDISEEPKSSEEQVRVWCVDALRMALGYDDSDLDTERKVMGGRIDIAVKDGDTVLMVIECKNIRKHLRQSTREQAGSYAATLSAPWAVTSNGNIWKLYRVTQQRGKSPRMDLIFDVAMLDEDGVSEADAEHLYLLSKRALQSGDTEKQYHEVRATSLLRVYNALFSERGLTALRQELKKTYKDEFGENVQLTDEDAEDALNDLLTPLEFGM